MTDEEKLKRRRESNRKSYYKNIDKRKQYLIENKETIKFRKQKWNENNKEKRLAYLRQYREEHKEEIKNYKLSLKGRFNRLINQALERKLDCEITLQEYEENYWERPCTYCGHNTFGGIDRIDNTKGYISGNMNPCCWTCNSIKKDLSIEEFIDHIDRIHSYFVSNYKLESSR